MMNDQNDAYYFTFEGANLQESLFRSEWLLTDGLGGWASQSISGSLTRRYHSLFLINSKQGRINYLPQIEEFVGNPDLAPISTNIYGNAIYPEGFLKIEKVLVGPTVKYHFRIGEDLLVKEIVKSKNENRTFISYQWFGKNPIKISVVPLFSLTSFHNLRHSTKNRLVDSVKSDYGLVFRSLENFHEFYLETDTFKFTENIDWFYGFKLQEEQNRGLDHSADLFSLIKLNCTLKPGEGTVFSLSTKPSVGSIGENLLETKERLFSKIKNNKPTSKIFQAKVDSALALSCQDYFIDTNRDKAGIVAGYHWFEEWGRDTFIVLNMLTSIGGNANFGNFEMIFQIFQDFFFKNKNGILPNRFYSSLDSDAEFEAEYNSVDSLLWAVLALWNFNSLLDDKSILKPLWLSAFQCMNFYIKGSDYGIYVEKNHAQYKGLLFSGDVNTQLTWMDARVNGVSITPRNGACVEINALWYNCLRICHKMAKTFDDITLANTYEEMAIEAYSSFRRNFCLPDEGYLADVVRNDYQDKSFRPNQIFAISLPFSLLDTKEARMVLFKIEKELLTDYGLRTLSFMDTNYKPQYRGGPFERDSAYHQGTVWPWLIWPYSNAVLKFAEGDLRSGLEKVVENLSSHIFKNGCGHVSEVFGGGDNQAGGAIAQAWSTIALKHTLEKLRE